MTENEIAGLINYAKNTCQMLKIDTVASTRSWFKMLGEFGRNDAMDAVDEIVSSGNIPAASQIRHIIERKRMYERNQRDMRKADAQRTAADRSFDGVPGKDRREQVLYIQAQRSAEHWANGERDNDYFNSKILEGQRIGFVFDGVNYDEVSVSSGYTGDILKFF